MSMLINIDSEKLGNMIEETLKNYKLKDLYYYKSEGEHYPLYKKLCIDGESVEKGYERINNIVDAIVADIICYMNKEEVK